MGLKNYLEFKTSKKSFFFLHFCLQQNLTNLPYRMCVNKFFIILYYGVMLSGPVTVTDGDHKLLQFMNILLHNSKNQIWRVRSACVAYPHEIDVLLVST
jgi:hypothetical protein